MTRAEYFSIVLTTEIGWANAHLNTAISSLRMTAHPSVEPIQRAELERLMKQLSWAQEKVAELMAVGRPELVTNLPARAERTDVAA